MIAKEKNILIIENDHIYINKLRNVLNTLSVEHSDYIINVSNAIRQDDFEKVENKKFEIIFIGYDFLLIQKKPIANLLKKMLT